MAERGAITGDRCRGIRFAARALSRGRHVVGARAARPELRRGAHRKPSSPRCGCLAGLSRLPNDCGIGGRVLPTNGGALARGLEAGFAVAFAAILGVAPAAATQIGSAPRQTEIEFGEPRRQIFQPPHRHVLAAAENRAPEPAPFGSSVTPNTSMPRDAQPTAPHGGHLRSGRADRPRRCRTARRR